MSPKHIIVWGINYAPELTGIAPCNVALCDYLAGQSHTVTMVTAFAYYPEWRKRAEDRGRFFRQDRLGGVDLQRCWHYVPRAPSTLKRIIHELTFVMFSWLKIMLLPRPDIYVVVSPPLLLGAAAWLAALLKRAPFVFHVQDLQPDAAHALGMMKRGVFTKALYALEAFAYRKAALVSGIIPGMTRAFAQKGVPESKIALFPNGIELPPPEAFPPRGRFRQKNGIGADELVATYSGNLGAKHGVEILLDAAQRLRGRPIRTVICGDGARREFLEHRAREMSLTNVLFLPLQAESDYQEMMVDTDAYFVTQQAGSGALFFPSKLLKGLAFSRAIVIVADAGSELTAAAEQGGFAVVTPPDQPAELAAALERLAQNPREREALGMAGRAYVERYESQRVLAAFAARLEALLEPDRELPTARPMPAASVES